MKWSMDTHKFMSEITRKALQILATRGITSESEPAEIDNAERELAKANVYKTDDAAKGRIRRALFTYFKAYGCLDENEHLTEIGELFADNKISVRELCFHYVLNYQYEGDETKYYPVQLLLTCIKALGEREQGQGYLSAYDFSKIVECQSLEQIDDAFIDNLLEARHGDPINVDERKVGFDVWTYMLTSAGIVRKTSDRTLVATSRSLADWILSAYDHDLTYIKGRISTGVFEYLPILQLNNPSGDAAPYMNEGKALQAYLFDRIDDRVIKKYVYSSVDNTFDNMVSTLGLSPNGKSFYASFEGLERLIGYCLLENERQNIRIIGSILTTVQVLDTELISERFDEPVKYRTDYQSSFERNRILFGAPGTGKSYTLNGEAKQLLGESNDADYERVTFHPDYSYANFVGTYKPIPCKDGYGNDAITYAYVPGPFMRVYVKALKNSREDVIKPFLLIVEEINRANVAAVFGDIFQLLDRGDDNVSEYPIQASEDIKKYLSDELGGSPEDYAKIRIPDNMFLWATMNSADQGVFPMDTAFKRRWDFTYLGIDDSDKDIRGKYVYLADDKSQKVEWNKLRKAINNFLARERINEDKQLGPYFISRSIVVPADGGDEIDRDSFIRVFKNKVIMYLFDDAAKQRRAKLFEGCFEDNSRYSEICREFEAKGVGIFNAVIQKESGVDDVDPEDKKSDKGISE